MIRRYDFDGFRIDTLKHVEHEFWQDFAPQIRKFVHGEQSIYGVPPLSQPKKNWFMFGEAFDGDDPLLGEFTYNNEVDSVFTFRKSSRSIKTPSVQRSDEQDRARLWNDRLRFDTATMTPAVHGQYRKPGRFRTVDGDSLPDPVAGKPIYNQTAIPGGAVDSQGVGIAPSKLLVNFLDNPTCRAFCRRSMAVMSMRRRLVDACTMPCRCCSPRRHSLHLLRHRAGLRGRQRSSQPRAHVRHRARQHLSRRVHHPARDDEPVRLFNRRRHLRGSLGWLRCANRPTCFVAAI